MLPGPRHPAPADPRQRRRGRSASCAASLRGIGLVRRRRPAVVVVLGGYAAVACGVGAVLLARADRACVEQNARAGAANRVAAPLRHGVAPCRSRAPTCPGHGRHRQPGPARDPARWPTRPRPRRRPARRSTCRPTASVIGVFAGSLGSRRINDAVRGLVEPLGATAPTSPSATSSAAATATARRRRCPALPDGGLVYHAVSRTRTAWTCCSPAPTSSSPAPAASVVRAGRRRPPVDPRAAAHRHRATTRPPTPRRWSQRPAPPSGARRRARRPTASRAELEPLVADPARRAAMGAHAARLAHPDAADASPELIADHARR